MTKYTVEFIQDYVRDMMNPATPDFQYLSEHRIRCIVKSMDSAAITELREYVDGVSECLAMDCFDSRAQRVDGILCTVGNAIVDFFGH